MNRERIFDDVERYYSEKVRAHGPTPRGVDWNSAESQALRFEQLLKVCDPSVPYRLIDLGCGYGALLDYLRDRGDPVEYLGIDLSETMIAEARRLHQGEPSKSFRVGHGCDETADYVVASGIFNIKQESEDGPWHDYILETIRTMAGMARRGFAFNALTSYSDPWLRRPDLYYADPCRLFDHCKRTYSRHVSLLHDYGLYEFSILVRLEPKQP